jgi:hypothetical protein
MPHTAGTHMPSMARMTWIWTTVRARRALSPSPTTIPTRMLTTSQTGHQTRQRPYLPYLPPDPSARRPGKRLGKVTMDPDKGTRVTAHTTTIMNVGEGEDMGGDEVGDGDGDAVVPVKGIRYHIAQKIIPRRTVLLHHCRRPRPRWRQQPGNIMAHRSIHPFPRSFHHSSGLRSRIRPCSSNRISTSSYPRNNILYNRTSIPGLRRISV